MNDQFLTAMKGLIKEEFPTARIRNASPPLTYRACVEFKISNGHRNYYLFDNLLFSSMDKYWRFDIANPEFTPELIITKIKEWEMEEERRRPK